VTQKQKREPEEELRATAASIRAIADEAEQLLRDVRIVILHWPDDPERGQEVIGPFASDFERTRWIEEVEAADKAGDSLLKGTHFIITNMDPPFAVQR
jgi:hypothetical protein